MKMDNKDVIRIANMFRGRAPLSDYTELFTIGALFMYLNENQKYKGIVEIPRILRAEMNAREELLKTLNTIETEIPYFKGVFDELNILKQLESTQITRFFYELGTITSKKSSSPEKWLREALKLLVSDSGKEVAQHSTHEFINKLAIAILNPSAGSIYDGAVGYAGGLIEAQRHAWKNSNSLKLYGEEINRKAWAVSKIRLFIFGDTENQVVNRDILINPAFTEENRLKKFDFVYMDFPFSLKINNHDSLSNDQFNRFFYGVPLASNADFAFISHALAALNESGKAVVVTTEGSLYRGGAEGRIRENIILSDLVEAVIALPSGLYDGTNIPVNLIVFNKNKDESRKNKILFIQTNDLITEQGRIKKVLLDEDIDNINDIFIKAKEISGVSKIVYNYDLEESNLNVNRYVLPKTVELEGFGAVNFNIESLKDMNNPRLKDVTTLFRGFNVGSKNEESPDGKYRVVRLSDVQNGKLIFTNISRYHIKNNAKVDMYKLQKDDVILSIRGSTLKTAIVPINAEDLLLSQNFIGIRCSKNLDPNFLKVYLESPLGQYLLSNKMSGTAIPTLSRKDVETLEIPLPPIETQMNIMKFYLDKEAHVEKEMNRLNKEMMDLKSQTYSKMGIKEVFTL